jgi:hypothetical protein
LRESLSGLPLSKVSSLATSSIFFSIKSANLYRSSPRLVADILCQSPLVNALRAAITAFSTSGASACATLQITSPVAGLMVSNLGSGVQVVIFAVRLLTVKGVYL